MHENAHDKGQNETRRGLVITRGMSIHSRSLGISGECDVLEFHLGSEGIPLKGREGVWQPFPVEYKRGRPNPQSGDALQLCAQAMCIEEMLCCPVLKGALFYGETRRRQQVEFSEELRESVRESLKEMHLLYRQGRTPKVRAAKSCNAECFHFRGINVEDFENGIIRRVVNPLDAGVFIQRTGFERQVLYKTDLAVDGQNRREVLRIGAERNIRVGLQLVVNRLLAIRAEIDFVPVRKQILEHPCFHLVAVLRRQHAIGICFQNFLIVDHFHYLHGFVWA